MKLTEQDIENAVQWTIILLAVVAGGLIIGTVGISINQSLINTGIL